MSFLAMPAWAVGLGIAALAAVLFLLQRLRVRHREVEVVTTLFWAQAVEQTRARVLVQRFRHPWAYALVLAISALLWLGLAQPALRGGSDQQRVLLLDGSAAMAVGDRFQAAVQAVAARLEVLPQASTQVVLAGSSLTTVLAAGEHRALFAQRLRQRQPEATPPGLDRAVQQLLAARAAAGGLDIELFSAAALPAAVAELLPAGVTLHRSALPAAAAAANAGVVALGVSEAASGAFAAVDLLVEVAGSGADLPAPRLSLAGQELAATATPDGRRFSLVDLPARGGRVDVVLPGGDALSLDDRASLVLPDRAPLRVLASPALPASLRDALQADRGVAVVDREPADVVVRHGGEDLGARLPALELSADAEAAAFTVRHVAVADAAARLRVDFEQLGLAEIDSTALAQRAGRPIELRLELAERPSIAVWAALFGDGFDFRQSRACPLFVARAVRHLAGVQPLPFETAAGGLLRHGQDRLQLAGLLLDAAGAELRLPHAGEATIAGAAAAVSLLSPLVTLPPGADQLPAAAAGGDRSADLRTFAVLAALLLLLLEWLLVRRERMP